MPTGFILLGILPSSSNTGGNPTEASLLSKQTLNFNQKDSSNLMVDSLSFSFNGFSIGHRNVFYQYDFQTFQFPHTTGLHPFIGRKITTPRWTPRKTKSRLYIRGISEDNLRFVLLLFGALSFCGFSRTHGQHLPFI